MTQREFREDATERAATLIAQALAELRNGSDADLRQELSSHRAILLELASTVERHLSEQREQNLNLGGQLTTLAGSLDRLVSHLQGLSTLMSDLLLRLAEPQPAAIDEPVREAAPASEPAFQPGGEGLSLIVVAIPGFQALMEIQKALTSFEQVNHASVERFQEGDSRLLVSLKAPITASDLVAGLIRTTGQAMAIEDSNPELARLRVKVIPAS